MTTRKIGVLGLLAGLLLLVLGARADSAHALDVDGVIAELRSLRAVYVRSPEELPAGFDSVLTSWQTAPRRLVLAGDRTPGEEDPYVMTHPIFRFAWPDGRTLLVDAGLSPAEAPGFGRSMEWLGAGPVVCGRDAFSQIDPKTIGATVFSHLHIDHVDGLRVLCESGTTIPVRLSPEQRASEERFEANGRGRIEEFIEAGCIRDDGWEVASDELLVPGVTGFAGVHRIAVPGHTPGSQLIVGFIARDGAPPRVVAVAGDVVNHRAAIRHDRPKPWWYRRLLVREDDALQGQNRALLAQMAAEGIEIRVNHHIPVPEGTAEGPCE